jgi:hypothetical protein
LFFVVGEGRQCEESTRGGVTVDERWSGSIRRAIVDEGHRMTAPNLLTAPVRLAGSVIMVGLVIGVGLLGYQAVRGDVAASIYRDRLVELSAEYQQLRDRYNRAINRTAVTELVVARGALSARIRTADGVTRTFQTPFDPSGEIYVDYVVLDGRVWIRRIFDAQTAPSQGMIIDPALANVDWATEDPVGTLRVGKAVYRSLSDGRWIVTVAGNGSLGLERAGDADVDLVTAPVVDEFEPTVTTADAAVDSITLGDVWESLW